MRGLVFAAIILAPIAAIAQTGQQNALATIEQFESGGQNIPQQTGATNSTASGYYQITNSTWNTVIAPNTGLPLVGPGTSSVNGVINLSATQQQQGAAYLYSVSGFSPWTCSGCNAQLAAYIAQQGGASAFSLNGGVSPTTTNSGGITVTAATVSSTPGTLSSPFSWEWNQMVGTTQNAVQGEVQAIQLMVAHYLPPLLVLAVIILGLSTWLGRSRYDTLVSFAVRLVLVMPFVTAGSQLYQNWVVQPVMGLPAWWQSWVISGIGGAGGGLSSPVSLLDQVYNGVSSAADKMASTASPWHVAHAIEIVFVGLTAKILTALGLAAMFVAIAVTTVLTFVALIVGPIIIPLTLFAVTRQVFWSWAGVVGTLLLSLLAIDIMLTLYEANMTAMLGAMTLSGTPDTDAPAVIALGIMVFILGSSVVFVPAMMVRIGGGVVAALDGAAWYLAGGPVRAAALAPVRMVGRRWGLS